MIKQGLRLEKRDFIAVGTRESRPRRIVLSRAKYVDRSVRLRTLVGLGMMGVLCLWGYDEGVFDNAIEWFAQFDWPEAPGAMRRFSDWLYRGR